MNDAVSGECSNDKIVVNMVWATIFSLLLLIFSAIVIGIPYYFIWVQDTGIKLFPILTDKLHRILFIAVCITGLFLHELIHGLFFGLFAENGFKAIKIYFEKNVYTFVCLCKDKLKIKHFMVGTIMPMTILGLIPTILALITGKTPLLVFGLLYIAASGGDILIIKAIMGKNKNDWIVCRKGEIGFNIMKNNA
jgi:hypothetical protein